MNSIIEAQRDFKNQRVYLQKYSMNAYEHYRWWYWRHTKLPHHTYFYEKNNYFFDLKLRTDMIDMSIELYNKGLRNT